MSQVEFEEFKTDSYSYGANMKETPSITRWVINSSGGLIKTKIQAEVFLVFLIIVSIFLSIFLLKGDDKNSAAIYPILPAELR